MKKNTARATVVPTFDVEEFAKEAVKLTVVPPPSSTSPVWAWLNEETAVPKRSAITEIVGDIDHRAAFLLLHVDGISTLSEIVTNSGVLRPDALSSLATLLNRGLIRLEDHAAAPPSGIRELASPKKPVSKRPSSRGPAREDDDFSLEAIAANW